MSPEKLARSPFRRESRAPYQRVRRCFENSATAAHDAISAGRFGSYLVNAEQPPTLRAEHV
jgi:hypothetical protein